MRKLLLTFAVLALAVICPAQNSLMRFPSYSAGVVTNPPVAVYAYLPFTGGTGILTTNMLTNSFLPKTGALNGPTIASLTNSAVIAGGRGFVTWITVGGTNYGGQEANTLVITNTGGQPTFVYGFPTAIYQDMHITFVMQMPNYHTANNVDSWFYNVGFYGTDGGVFMQTYSRGQGTNFIGLSPQTSLGIVHDESIATPPGWYKVDLGCSYLTGKCYLTVWNADTLKLVGSLVDPMPTNASLYWYSFKIDQAEYTSDNSSNKLSNFVISTNVPASAPILQ